MLLVYARSTLAAEFTKVLIHVLTAMFCAFSMRMSFGSIIILSEGVMTARVRWVALFPDTKSAAVTMKKKRETKKRTRKR